MERLTLPEPAQGTWRRWRGEIRTLADMAQQEGRGWEIGGGTILAARWKHRTSRDIDVSAGGDAALLAIAGPRAETAEDRLRQAGAKITRNGPVYEIAFPGSEGEHATIQICRLEPWPAGQAADALVDGEAARVQSTTQILAGKLRRAAGIESGQRAPVRDVYDLLAAGRKHPEALRAAVLATGNDATRNTAALLERADAWYDEQVRRVPAEWERMAPPAGTGKTCAHMLRRASLAGLRIARSGEAWVVEREDHAGRVDQVRCREEDREAEWKRNGIDLTLELNHVPVGFVLRRMAHANEWSFRERIYTPEAYEEATSWERP